MPSIAQQDYIFIPILDGGEVPQEISQEIQNQLYQIAQRGNGLDVVFTQPDENFAYKPFSVRISGNSAFYSIYDPINKEIITFEVAYAEITNEPDAQEEH